MNQSDSRRFQLRRSPWPETSPSLRTFVNIRARQPVDSASEVPLERGMSAAVHVGAGIAAE
jgi:hypothetical protein